MRRIEPAAAALAITVLLVYGCGEPTSADERVAAAARTTAEEGSAAFSLGIEVEMGRQKSGMDLTMSGEGVADLEEGRGRMELSSAGLATDMTMVFERDVAYVQLPTYLTGGTAQWVRQRAGGSAGVSPGRGLGQNPLSMLDALDAVEGEIRELGSETIRGTGTRGFGLTIAGAKLWDEAEDVPPGLLALDIPSELWLDDRNRVRRMVMEVDLGPVMDAVRQRATDTLGEDEASVMNDLLKGMQGTMTMTAELFDFGTAVDVRLPDESVVIEEGQLRRRMGVSGAGGAETGGDAEAGGNGTDAGGGAAEADRGGADGGSGGDTGGGGDTGSAGGGGHTGSAGGIGDTGSGGDAETGGSGEAGGSGGDNGSAVEGGAHRAPETANLGGNGPADRTPDPATAGGDGPADRAPDRSTAGEDGG